MVNFTREKLLRDIGGFIELKRYLDRDDCRKLSYKDLTPKILERFCIKFFARSKKSYRPVIGSNLLACLKSIWPTLQDLRRQRICDFSPMAALITYLYNCLSEETKDSLVRYNYEIRKGLKGAERILRLVYYPDHIDQKKLNLPLESADCLLKSFTPEEAERYNKQVVTFRKIIHRKQYAKCIEKARQVPHYFAPPDDVEDDSFSFWLKEKISGFLEELIEEEQWSRRPGRPSLGPRVKRCSGNSSSSDEESELEQTVMSTSERSKSNSECRSSSTTSPRDEIFLVFAKSTQTQPYVMEVETKSTSTQTDTDELIRENVSRTQRESVIKMKSERQTKVGKVTDGNSTMSRISFNQKKVDLIDLTSD